MFRCSAILLTITAMLVRSIIGCCWHSGHDSVQPSSMNATDSVARSIGSKTQQCGHDHAWHSHQHGMALTVAGHAGDTLAGCADEGVPCDHDHDQSACLFVVTTPIPAPILDAPLWGTEFSTVDALQGLTDSLQGVLSPVDLWVPLPSTVRALTSVWLV